MTRPTTHPAGTTGHLARYGTGPACLAALLTLFILTVRLVTVPLALAALLGDRLVAWLDRWLARVPLPPIAVVATATRLPTVATRG